MHYYKIMNLAENFEKILKSFNRLQVDYIKVGNFPSFFRKRIIFKRETK